MLGGAAAKSTAMRSFEVVVMGAPKSSDPGEAG